MRTKSDNPRAVEAREARARLRAERDRRLLEEARLRVRLEHDAAAFRAVAGIRGRHPLQTIVERLGGVS